MKGNAVMMGATIVMVAAVAIVLSLVLLLLAELYCTLLLRKRRRNPNTTPSSTSIPIATTAAAAAAPSLCSFYAQGVIRAPRSFLFPTALPSENPNSEKQLIFHNNLRYSSSARIDHRDTASPDSTSTSGGGADQLIYICNPMYDGEEAKIIGNTDSPFETPATSPSKLDIETGRSSSSGGSSPPISTPQLTPMKKLPAEGASVPLNSMCTTPSESNTIFGGASSSSSASPSTSPSWWKSPRLCLWIFFFPVHFFFSSPIFFLLALLVDSVPLCHLPWPLFVTNINLDIGTFCKIHKLGIMNSLVLDLV